MKKRHHLLDVHPIPEERAPLFVNEPRLTDPSILDIRGYGLYGTCHLTASTAWMA